MNQERSLDWFMASIWPESTVAQRQALVSNLNTCPISGDQDVIRAALDTSRELGAAMAQKRRGEVPSDEQLEAVLKSLLIAAQTVGGVQPDDLERSDMSCVAASALTAASTVVFLGTVLAAFILRTDPSPGYLERNDALENLVMMIWAASSVTSIGSLIFVLRANPSNQWLQAPGSTFVARALKIRRERRSFAKIVVGKLNLQGSGIQNEWHGSPRQQLDLIADTLFATFSRARVRAACEGLLEPRAKAKASDQDLVQFSAAGAALPRP